ncbi:1627_t:CDS:2, partial [Cetraspora pellucida]
FYPPKDKICCTVASSHNGSKYRVLNNYLVQTSWGRNKSRHMVECEIEYEQDGSIFIIRFEENSQQYVLISKKSLTNVANDYLQKKCPNTCATISRIHVFGLNAMDVKQERDRKKKLPLSLKPFNSLSESMKIKKSRAFSIHLGKSFD